MTQKCAASSAQPSLRADTHRRFGVRGNAGEQSHQPRDTGCRCGLRRRPMPNRKTLDVHISNLRLKLKPFGVELVTIRKVGFRLAEDARDKINRLLGEHGAAIMTPAEPAAASPD